ncbi:MAG: polyprenyl diphosphate synthase [Patescibacteria group bacterium]
MAHPSTTTSVPTCLGFIMDGNRRWAKEQGVPSVQGHKKGFEVWQESVQWVRDAGIPHAVYYAFSTENWRRSDEEVGYLMDLFRSTLGEIRDRLDKEDSEKPVHVRTIGRREDFASDIQDTMAELEARNREGEAHTTIWLALSYGGRAEIIDAANRAIASGAPVSEATFEQLLWSAELPDPDLIVRTGGEQRLSNFMTWRSVYSEFLFLEKYWPALTKADFADILAAYAARERRCGR